MTMTSYAPRGRPRPVPRRRYAARTIVDAFKETARAPTANRPALRWPKLPKRIGAPSPGPKYEKTVTASRRPACATGPRTWRPRRDPRHQPARVAHRRHRRLGGRARHRPRLPDERGESGRLRARPQRSAGLLRRERRPVGQGPAPTSGPPCARARRGDRGRARPRRRLHQLAGRSSCRRRGRARLDRPAGSTSSSRT